MDNRNLSNDSFSEEGKRPTPTKRSLLDSDEFNALRRGDFVESFLSIEAYAAVLTTGLTWVIFIVVFIRIRFGGKSSPFDMDYWDIILQGLSMFFTLFFFTTLFVGFLTALYALFARKWLAVFVGALPIIMALIYYYWLTALSTFVRYEGILLFGNMCITFTTLAIWLLKGMVSNRSNDEDGELN